ncbi:6-phosphofructokinase [Wenzhouxiangella marina]|uniref:Pyrophosphate--fructose 6-phosphate 1-phosphotransferase n=1 Tax=Wenzhouxiangella marina TaxID=1579979 RepID=A0A0K0XSJ6_9GAMM|nr:6-phosphofructokinase [Wenzhouxiangella marina]AKS40658.1 6-phosphofructokinase [Wenzhouxiangella marina]MBB6088428.1 6-phosphofructokinase 1 [Wenzhouxiangella marina]
MAGNNLLYAQSGGVTPVINATAAALIEAARGHSDRLGKVFAARDGILGVLEERLIDTSTLTATDLQALAKTPGGTFGSCRYKLKGMDENRREYERLIEVFRAHDIGYFFYNGGNDSADTALKISEMARSHELPLQCIAVPKTIDNDLAVTDNCPGFGSVAKYIAVSIREASLDVMAMASTSTKVFILEVMGRHAGWIAAAGGLAARRAGDPPQIILFPEVPFEEADFLAAVRDSVERHGYCSIVVSEGARWSDGRFLADSGTTDAFGHKQLGGVAPVVADLVKSQTGFKCHWAVSDYLQRSARHLASATDVAHARAVGEAAVEFALAGRSGVMPVIKRLSDAPYSWTIDSAELGDIANREKTVPRDFISPDGFGITEAARAYLEPLIRGEDYPAYGSDGQPLYLTPDFDYLSPRLPAFEV